MKKKLNIVMLVHDSLVPPEGISQNESYDKPWRSEYAVKNSLLYLGHNVKVLGLNSELKPIRDCIKDFQPDIAFNMLEEFQGEAIYDAHVVSYLELLKLKYTGCNPRGLILARDKALSKKILTYHRIPVPRFKSVRRGKKVSVRGLEYPVIVKSLNEESSMGISKASLCHDEKALTERLDYVFDTLGTDAIIEEFIEGREIYIGGLGNQRVEVLPPSETIFTKSENPSMEFATSNVKWNEKYRKEHGIQSDICKNLDPKTMRKLNSLLKKVFKVLDLNSYARLDIRLKGDVPYVLEANPNPGIAPEDEFAFTAEAKGYSFEALIDKIVRLGMNYRR